MADKQTIRYETSDESKSKGFPASMVFWLLVSLTLIIFPLKS